MTCDGQELRFPTRTEKKSLKQAARNAGWLRKYLTKMTGEEVTVHPVLTLPGWMIERTGKGPVSVLNPKEIRALVVESGAVPLSEDQRERIINLIDEKCRHSPY